MQDLFINIMFVIGVVAIGGYLLLWIFNPKMREKIEAPKFEMLERDRKIWKDQP